MPYTFRKRYRLGPLPIWLNLTKTGDQPVGHSFTWRLFGVSRNSRTEQISVDLPGPVNWRSRRRSTRKRTR